MTPLEQLYKKQIFWISSPTARDFDCEEASYHIKQLKNTLFGESRR
jgi:hypothetical protein